VKGKKMAIGHFSKKPAANAATKPPAPVAKKSRYAGLKAMSPREPMPEVGTYRFRVLSCTESKNPGNGNESFKAYLEVVESEGPKANPVGASVMALQMLGTDWQAGRVKSFIMAAAGFSDEEAYNAFDPEGLFVDACIGYANEFSAQGMNVNGRLVDCRVSVDKMFADGSDFFRAYEWAPVEDQ
jgi:hypothetical protein